LLLLLLLLMWVYGRLILLLQNLEQQEQLWLLASGLFAAVNISTRTHVPILSVLAAISPAHLLHISTSLHLLFLSLPVSVCCNAHPFSLNAAYSSADRLPR
jgi:hypothetical protein